MNTPVIDFDTSTANGQKRLMAVSMGLDSETYIPRCVTRLTALTPACLVPTDHPLTRSEIANAESLGNRAVYYWRFFVLAGAADNLTAAYQFMTDYRSAGGRAHEDTWEAILDAIKPFDRAAEGPRLSHLPNPNDL